MSDLMRPPGGTLYTVDNMPWRSDQHPAQDLADTLHELPASAQEAFMLGLRTMYERESAARRERGESTLPPPPPAEHVVYYVRFGDRVKIGTTGRLKLRLGCIPHDEVLAVEHGDRRLERQRHIEFADLRLTPRGEWFRYESRLREHIASLLAGGYAFTI